MLNRRIVLLLAPLTAYLGGCSASPVVPDAFGSPTPRYDTGQTLGSGHRDDGGSTTATASTTTVAADSGTTLEGQTLGSGH